MKKPSNPKDAVGIRKPPTSTVPQNVIAEVGVGMLEGALKYGRHNYRVIGVRSSVYYDAARRHLDYWWEGEDIDQDSGLSHVTKAICALIVIRDAMLNGKCNDDRPPKTDVSSSRERLTTIVEELLDKYDSPEEAFTEANKNLRGGPPVVESEGTNAILRRAVENHTIKPLLDLNDLKTIASKGDKK